VTTFAAVQMTSGPEVEANLAAAGSLIEAAVGAGASVVLLPENFNFIGRRDGDKRAIAEGYGGGPTQDFLAATARRHGIWIIGGTLPLRSEAADGRVTNSLLVYDAGGRCVARYDKIHLFDVDVPGKPGETYRESSNVAPGRDVVLVDTPAGRVGLSVC
jgi:nitrilase